MDYKDILGALAMAIAFGSHLPYIIAIYKDKMRPHKFSWIIWGLTTFIVFLAQLSDGAGAGSWAGGLTVVMVVVIVLMAYWKNPRLSITRSDWIFFLSALACIPLWYITQNPVWSVIILTTIDALGYWPTVRKAHAQPYEESGWLFFLQTIKNIIVLTALENYSLTTMTFPVAMVFMNLLVPAAIFLGRLNLKRAV
jgi:hypothetical protein